MKAKHFFFAVGISLASAFTFSCSSDDSGGSEASYSYCIMANNTCLDGPFTASTCNGQLSNSCPFTGLSSSSGGNTSSSSVDSGGSSSSVGGGSSSSAEITEFTPANCTGYNPSAPSNKGTLTDSRDGKVYNTVKICDQTWMAENLNFDVPNNDTDVCYDNDPSNCETYGRLYDWITAMGIDERYNNDTYGTNNYCLDGNFCISDPAVTTHQGICPSGWHLPSASKIYALVVGLGASTSTFGAKLKATDGWDWNDDDNISGNGTDDYGFAALPGGEGGPDGNANLPFQNIGKRAFWWSASESPRNSSHILYVRHSRNGVWLSDMASNNKVAKFSIRCVKDN